MLHYHVDNNNGINFIIEQNTLMKTTEMFHTNFKNITERLDTDLAVFPLKWRKQISGLFSTINTRKSDLLFYH